MSGGAPAAHHRGAVAASIWRATGGSIFHRSCAAAERFCLGYQFDAGVGIGVGAKPTVLSVTDFRGNGGNFLAVGPQLITNKAIGLSPVGQQFFPRVNFDGVSG